MRNNVNIENVLIILEQAIRFDEGKLEEECWDLVELCVADVVVTEAFNNMNQKTLACLLRREHLSTSEVTLFQARHILMNKDWWAKTKIRHTNPL